MTISQSSNHFHTILFVIGSILGCKSEPQCWGQVFRSKIINEIAIGMAMQINQGLIFLTQSVFQADRVIFKTS